MDLVQQTVLEFLLYKTVNKSKCLDTTISLLAGVTTHDQ